jgi:hypothetical protein
MAMPETGVRPLASPTTHAGEADSPAFHVLAEGFREELASRV